MGKTKYALCVHILSEGRCSYSPLPFSLFQSQVGHSLISHVASALSPKMNCMHRDIIIEYIGRGPSIKKAESYYCLSTELHKLHGHLSSGLFKPCLKLRLFELSKRLVPSLIRTQPLRKMLSRLSKQANDRQKDSCNRRVQKAHNVLQKVH